jgi:Ca2+-binding EF-hand superfamily protein
MRPMTHYLVLIAAAAGAVTATLAMAVPSTDVGEEFTMMDTNKDGKISADEHRVGAKVMFEKMDANKDGAVTADEMAAAHKMVTGKVARKTDMSPQDKIKAVDGDGDGRLTAAEHTSASERMFAKMDTNKDGFLTRQELAAGHAGIMKK